MKKLLIISSVVVLAACNNAGTTDAAKKDSAGTATVTETKRTIPEMPFQLPRPYKNWQPGDPQHALTVMTSLKAFESGDVAKSMEAFADTVELNFDQMGGRFSRDSVGKMFTMHRSDIASMTIKMEDWESVIAEDKSREYVTLWYKQIWTDKKGKTDSVDCVDDARIVNGKIAELSETSRRYPPAKK